MQVTRELEIDVSREHRNWTTMAKQYDINSRFLQVRLMNDGEPISVGENTYVVFKVQRIDGQFKSFRGSVCPDGAVRVPLSAWALKVGEYIRCEIIIIDAETEKQLLTSGQFKIEVEPSISTGDEVADDGNYDILVSLIADVDGAVTEAKEAAEAANTAKAGADAAAAEARDAAKNAELSKSAVDEATKAAYDAADAANAAKSAADTATESANSAAESANSAAERANDAAQKAESATEASELATEAAKKATSEATASADKAEQAADSANAAKSAADAATEAAKRATEGANASKADADAAAERANKSADAADTATDNANRAADSASKAADAANIAKKEADTAAQSANEAADAANTSKSAADIATNRANDAAQAANTAAGAANDAATAANMAAGSVGNAVTAARDAAANANEIAGIASDAADTANAAAENADEAASNANAAAEAANVAKQGADTAAENADNAASSANTAASSANDAARSANAAADAANASKQAADDAADNANRAASSANKWSKVSASIEMLDPAASPSVSVTDSADGTGKDMKFSVPTGKTGLTPNITIGKVNTVPAGTPSAVRMSGTPENPVLEFDVTQGEAGSVTSLWGVEPDETGDVSPRIGGRNLLRNSLDPNVIPYGGSTVNKTNGIEVPEWGTSKAFRLTGVSGTSITSALICNYSNDIDNCIPGGAICAMSVYARNDGNTQIKIGRVKFETLNPGEMKHIAVSSKISNSSVNSMILVSTQEIGEEFDLVLWHPYIGIGEVAPDWTPAPEDKQDKLTGTAGQVVGFDADGNAVAVSPSSVLTDLELAATELYETLLQNRVVAALGAATINAKSTAHWVSIYANLVRNGDKLIENVPEHLREEVRAILEAETKPEQDHPNIIVPDELDPKFAVDDDNINDTLNTENEE